MVAGPRCCPVKVGWRLRDSQWQSGSDRKTNGTSGTLTGGKLTGRPHTQTLPVLLLMVR